MSKKVVIFETEDWEFETFEKLKNSNEVLLVRESVNEKIVAEYRDASIVSAFVTLQFNKSILKEFYNLELIATRSTGFDHIDLEYCRSHNITVSNVPKYGANTVAEHTFALLLGISHRLIEASDRTQKGDFSSRGLQGFDLMGKKIGVIGTGDIGMHVIRIAKGFCMDVLAYDINPDHRQEKSLGFHYVDLEELIQESDVISLHLPSNKKTKNMISSEEFEMMKEGVVILNTARGDVLNIQALTKAIAEGKVAGAGLDVLPEEPVIREEVQVLRSVYERKHNLSTLLADSLLPRLRNVIVTPHSAFNTREAVRRIADTTLENIQAFLGGEPQNTIQD